MQMKQAPKIYASMSPKGGVGKTTSVTTLALYCSLILKKKVLVIDLDNIGSLTNNLQGDQVRHVQYSNVTDLYLDPEKNSQIKVSPINEYLDLIQGDSGIKDINSKNSIELISRLEDNLLQHIPNYEEYTYVIIDTPAGVGNSVLSALICADYIYTPIDLDPNAISAIDELTSVLKPIKRKMNSKLAWKGILINRVQKLINTDNGKVPESLNHREVFLDLKERFSGHILGVVGLRNPIQTAFTKGNCRWVAGRDSSAQDADLELKNFCNNLLGI